MDISDDRKLRQCVRNHSNLKTMTAKLAVEGPSNEGETVRRPASAADILGRIPGTKVKAPPKPTRVSTEVLAAQQAEARKSSFRAFASVDGGLKHSLDEEISRSRV